MQVVRCWADELPELRTVVRNSANKVIGVVAAVQHLIPDQTFPRYEVICEVTRVGTARELTVEAPDHRDPRRTLRLSVREG